MEFWGKCVAFVTILLLSGWRLCITVIPFTVSSRQVDREVSDVVANSVHYTLGEAVEGQPDFDDRFRWLSPHFLRRR